MRDPEISGHFNPFYFALSFILMNQQTETFGCQQEKQRRKRAALPEASFRSKKRGSSTIDQKGNFCRRNTAHDPSNKIKPETKMSK